jgi:thymidylate synthase
MTTFNTVYYKLLLEVWHYGSISQPRGMKVKELIGYRFFFDEGDGVVTLDGFETNKEYAALELEWYYAATNEINFHPTIKRTWERFSDDGITVNSAYGYRIFGKHPLITVNQWDWVISKLREDRDSRQCVININLPSDKLTSTRDFPCTVYIQVFIRNNTLHWITNIRSTDIYLGIRNDVYCFREMQKRMAHQLGVGVGKYIQFCGSIHLYEKNFEKAKKIAGDNNE